MSLTDIAEEKYENIVDSISSSPNKEEIDKSEEHFKQVSQLNELKYTMKGDPSYKLQRD